MRRAFGGRGDLVPFYKRVTGIVMGVLIGALMGAFKRICSLSRFYSNNLFVLYLERGLLDRG
jgi:hypothetical protein